MGRDVNENGGRVPKGKGKALSSNAAGIYTYHPSTVDRAALSEGAFDISWAMEVLTGRLERGITITLGCRVDSGAIFALARTSESNWQDRRAVSYWHSNTERALIGLAYYLQRVNQEWPDTVQLTLPGLTEW